MSVNRYPDENANNNEYIDPSMKGNSSASLDSTRRFSPVGERGRKAQQTNAPSPAEIERRRRIKEENRKKEKRRRRRNNVLLAILVLAASAVLSCIGISCVNDILAVAGRSDDIISVEITDDEDTVSVIDKLHDAGLIKNKYFCIIMAKLFGYVDDGYIAGVYSLQQSMGLENMIDSIKQKDSSDVQTVSVTFPEGYTMEQILDLLEENEVCTREKMLAAMEENDYSSEYSFIAALTDSDSRYYYLEGYMYPDTYEFYIGESADSVIRKFLDNFETHWIDEYSELAEEKGLTIDQVIILASIVEKEGATDDMPYVASVLINRLSYSMQLQCDSTVLYEETILELAGSSASLYEGLWDTYVCADYPVSAICNPGESAISAVLNAPDTTYIYFYYDSSNEIHLASSLTEHNNNILTYS